jgi:hypothetical protein
MRAWGAVVVVLLGGVIGALVAGSLDDKAPRSLAQAFETAGVSLTAPPGWRGRATAFDPRERAPLVEVRSSDGIRISVVELGNTPGVGRFPTTALPISLRRQDALAGAEERAGSVLLGRLFATHGRSFSVQAELPRAELTRFLTVANNVIATLDVRPPPGMDAATMVRLERPLRLRPAQTGRCQRSQTGKRAPAVGYTLGEGPAFPVLTSGAGIAELERNELRGGWYRHKTLWAISPGYRGPLLVRGARIDAPGTTRFAGRSGLQRMLRLPGHWPGTTGWRYFPSATGLRGPGCYAFQIDGLSLTRVVMFEARL